MFKYFPSALFLCLQFGRKPLLLFGTLFMCFTMVLAATLILTLEDVNAAHYVVVVLICVFSACFMLTFR